MKIYDLTKKLLTEHSELRDSDKKLFWGVCYVLGHLKFRDGSYIITRDSFLKAPSTESVRRCRQKIQEHFPELRGSRAVQKARAEKAETKSTFIYREEVQENLI